MKLGAYLGFGGPSTPGAEQPNKPTGHRRAGAATQPGKTKQPKKGRATDPAQNTGQRSKTAPGRNGATGARTGKTADAAPGSVRQPAPTAESRRRAGPSSPLDPARTKPSLSTRQGDSRGSTEARGIGRPRRLLDSAATKPGAARSAGVRDTGQGPRTNGAGRAAPKAANGGKGKPTADITKTGTRAAVQATGQTKAERPAVKAAEDQFKARRRAARRAAVGRAMRWVVPVVVVAGVAALVYFTPVFAVRAGDIEVRGLGGWVDRAAVSEVLSQDVGVPLARLSTKRLEEALRAMPAVESAEVKRDWPTGLTVTLVPRVPAAAVLDGELYVLLDASAEQVAWVEEAPEGLPVIEVPLTEGNRRIVAAVLTVAASLPAELAQQVVSIGAKTEDTVAFKLTNGVEVIWGDSSGSALKAAAVEVLLGQSGVKQIDVSAPDSPVIR